MTGTYLSRLAQRLVRRETYESIVAPAIADLQYEGARGRGARLRGYIGVWRAVGAAFAGELAGDCVASVREADARSYVLPIAATIGLMATLFGYPVWGFGRRSLPWHHNVILQGLWVPTILAMLAPSVALPLAAMYARQCLPAATRAAVLLAVAISFAVALGSERIAFRLLPLRGELLMASIFSVRDGRADAPLWELRETFRAQLDEIAKANAEARAQARRGAPAGNRIPGIPFQHEAAVLFTALSFGLMGVAWSARQRWALPLLAFAVTIVHLGAAYIFQRVLYVQAVFGWGAARWAPAALVFLVAAWIVVRRGRAHLTCPPKL